MRVSFKNRIAFHYLIATAIIMAVAFTAIFITVRGTVMHNLDNDLSYEANKHATEIIITGDSLVFRNKEEWEQREHREVQVNPVFIQLIDHQGRLMDKSPNLKNDNLPFREIEAGGHFDTKIDNKPIRQVQVPITENKVVKGYILAAVSSESSFEIIRRLGIVLVFAYLSLISVLYFISRFLAGRAIKPIQNVTSTISRISKNNLHERVDLPTNKDEIHNLSTSFNALIERIEKAIEREKQFTSDASHELRTPLASLRGTLEVLIRKPRTTEEYEEKVKLSLNEIDRLTQMLEHLLTLARLDANAQTSSTVKTSIAEVVDHAIANNSSAIESKKLHIQMTDDLSSKAEVPEYYSRLIIENILNNAVKYSPTDATIQIKLKQANGKVKCVVSDTGCGVKKEDLEHIYSNFFRSDALNHKEVKGTGLGLSIAKKCAEAIDAEIDFDSVLGEGTTVTIIF